jgi:hypothetical protein
MGEKFFAHTCLFKIIFQINTIPTTFSKTTPQKAVQ